MTDDQSTPAGPIDVPVDEPAEGDEHDDDSLDDAALTTGQTTSALGVAAGGGDATLDAYDLDEDGKVSIIEGARAQLGVVDARLEQLGEHPGVVGKVAEAAHHLVDRLDNDDRGAGDPVAPGAADAAPADPGADAS
jgi:hypothetical protein